MNIKGLLGNMVTSPIRNGEEAKKAERTIKSDSTHDRDANGQQLYDQNKKNQQQGPMTDEQFKKAVEYLQALQSVKDQNWTVEVVSEGKLRFVLVKDTSGAIVRRIPEVDLWTLPFDKDVRTGQLLKKSA